VLAAGALATTKIYLDSLHHRGDRDTALGGVMDNRQIMVPFLTPSMLGAAVDTSSYQFHLLAMAIEGEDRADDVHGQITALKAASVHPIVQRLPFDLRTAVSAFRRIRTGLGVANIWLADRRNPDNTASVRTVGGDGRTELVVEYARDAARAEDVRRTIETTRRALGRLGCLVPKGMTQVLPKGSSVHYAGTLPMTRDDAPHTTTPTGQLRGFANLYVADGAAFPSLPAKNLTFTLMANAARVAEAVI
jgi:choline dehydrogenase-like flavoprotein